MEGSKSRYASREQWENCIPWALFIIDLLNDRHLFPERFEDKDCVTGMSLSEQAYRATRLAPSELMMHDLERPISLIQLQ